MDALRPLKKLSISRQPAASYDYQGPEPRLDRMPVEIMEHIAYELVYADATSIGYVGEKAYILLDDLVELRLTCRSIFSALSRAFGKYSAEGRFQSVAVVNLEKNSLHKLSLLTKNLLRKLSVDTLIFKTTAHSQHPDSVEPLGLEHPLYPELCDILREFGHVHYIRLPGRCLNGRYPISPASEECSLVGYAAAILEAASLANMWLDEFTVDNFAYGVDVGLSLRSFSYLKMYSFDRLRCLKLFLSAVELPSGFPDCLSPVLGRMTALRTLSLGFDHLSHCKTKDAPRLALQSLVQGDQGIYLPNIGNFELIGCRIDLPGPQTRRHLMLRNLALRHVELLGDWKTFLLLLPDWAAWLDTLKLHQVSTEGHRVVFNGEEVVHAPGPGMGSSCRKYEASVDLGGTEAQNTQKLMELFGRMSVISESNARVLDLEHKYGGDDNQVFAWGPAGTGKWLATIEAEARRSQTVVGRDCSEGRIDVG